MMSFYTVIQYIPNPVIGERVNIGVIVYSQGKVLVQFLHNWKRAQTFAKRDLSFLKDFASNIEQAAIQPQLPHTPGEWQLSETTIGKMIASWKGVIQLTEVGGGRIEIHELLARVSSEFLVQPAQVAKTYRDKRSAVAIAAQSIETALKSHLPQQDVKSLIKRDEPVSGTVMPQEFDVVAKNGRVYFAAQGLSFQIQDKKHLPDQIRLLTLAISDVHKHQKDLPVGVVVLPPLRDDEAFDFYEKAEKRLISVGASVISEDDALTWANRAVRESVPADLVVGHS